MHSKDWIPEFKSPFKQELADYIKFKRSNGYAYRDPICYRLKELDTFLASLNQEDPHIDQDVYEQWMMTCAKRNNENTRMKYNGVIFGFCEYLRMTGHENIIQPNAPKKFIKVEYLPYIFSDQEINRMFHVMIQKIKENPTSINHKTFYVLFCLYYGCGLRKSEAQNLKLKDFSSEQQTIEITDGKNNVSRTVPLSTSVFDHLNKYVSMHHYLDANPHIFIDNRGKHFSDHKLYEMFAQLLKEAKIPTRYDGKRQRIHDLRHLFAIKALNRMEEKGYDFYTSLPLLSVYLGHKHITETEYYLRLIKSETETTMKKVSEYLSNLYQIDGDVYEI